MLELVGIIATMIAVAGVWLNNHKLRACFYLWLVSNTLSAGIHLYLCCYSLFCRDVIFLVLALHGLRKWSRYPDPTIMTPESLSQAVEAKTPYGEASLTRESQDKQVYDSYEQPGTCPVLQELKLQEPEQPQEPLDELEIWQ